jgi:cytochrome c-type biogenesis protein CcmH
MNHDIPALREQLQQLQARHDAGELDDAAYAAAKAPLERQLLDRVMAAPQAVAVPAAAPAARPGWKLLASLLVAVVAVAVGGYSYTGAPGATVLAGSGGAPGASDPDAERAQFAAAVEQLAQRLQSEPDNHEGWAMLARSYARLGEHMKALPAFEKAGPLLETDAALVADYADTLAVMNDRSLQGAPSQWIERALKINPDHPKSLALAGTAAFERKDFAAAATHWERLVALAPADADFLPQLQASIAEARREGGLPASTVVPGSAVVATASPAAPTAAPTATGNTPAAASAARVQGVVRLAPALAQQVQPEDSVFVFARAAEGPRMPLAIARFQVKDLPLQFSLDDSQAMAPELQLSKFEKVIVTARVSKSGQAVPAPGDLTGQIGPVANTAQGLAIEINEVVKN